MITVYHLGVSQSDRIVWLMEELGLPYKLEWFDRGEDQLAPPAYRELHPVGTAPIIRDGDLVLSESGAICEYISQKHGNGALSVKPQDSNYANYLYWMQFSGNVQAIFFAKLAAADHAESSRALDMLLRREEAYYKFLNERLGEAPFLAGDALSCADIMAVFNLTSLPLFGGRTIDDLDNVKAYLERIQARPAYIKAMAIAGPNASRPEQPQ
jgi:glutathione S-transferase